MAHVRRLHAGAIAMSESKQIARPLADTTARRYYTKLVEMAEPGSARPELAQARAFLAANR